MPGAGERRVKVTLATPGGPEPHRNALGARELSVTPGHIIRILSLHDWDQSTGSSGCGEEEGAPGSPPPRRSEFAQRVVPTERGL